MKIGITGANGFIGTHLVEKLSKNKKLSLYFFDKTIHSLFNETSLIDFVSDKDIIIHLAGVKGLSDVAQLYEVNVLGTANLLHAIKKYGKKSVHFILSSSFLVYEENMSHMPLREDFISTVPTNQYGLSKYLSEKIVNYYNQTYNIKASILRIANVYGPIKNGLSHSVPNLFIEGVLNNKAITIRGSGDTVRDLIYVTDVVEALYKTIINQKKEYLLINVCTGKETKMIDVVTLVEIILKKKAVIRYETSFKEKAYWIGDGSHAKAEINFSPSVTIEEGIRKTIRWYLL